MERTRYFRIFKSGNRLGVPSDLGIGGWAQEEVADVGDDFGVSVAGRAAEFLPFRIGGKGAPILFARGHVFEGQHVGKVWHFGADQGFAEENRLQSGAAKDGDLAVVEHFDFLLVRLFAVALVSAEFEDATFVAIGSSRNFQFGNAAEGDHQRAFGADVSRISGRCINEIRAEFLVFGIGMDAVVGGGEGFERLVRDKDVHGGTVRADHDVEYADGTDASAIHGGNGGVAIEIVKEFLLGAAAKMVESQFVEFAHGRFVFFVGSVEGGGKGADAGGSKGGFKKFAALHSFARF
ncbi:MAG: hypothetical protein JWQ71_4548 [Pedosphaera sp.]|nr:hypothetical protein [Pedosphaera sp.]